MAKSKLDKILYSLYNTKLDALKNRSNEHFNIIVIGGQV